MHRALWPALLVLLALMVPGRADAASRKLGHFAGPLLSDERYLAVPGGSAQGLRVLDTRTGRRQHVASPAGCYPKDLAGGRVLYDCPTRSDRVSYGFGVSFDLGARRGSPLPPLPRAAFGMDTANTDDVRYLSAGRRWAEVEHTAYHVRFSQYVRLTDGSLGPGPGADRRLVANLDAESGVSRLCAPMQRPLGPDGAFLGLVPAPLRVVGRRAAAIHFSNATSDTTLRLQRCGRPPRTIHHCYPRCGDVSLDDRTLAWAEPTKLGSFVFIRDLRTGRTRSFPRFAPTELRLVSHRLYTLTAGELRVLTP